MPPEGDRLRAQRTFGITPLKEANQTDYVLDAVDKKDAGMPAWTLGVRPGWVGLRVNGESKETMELAAIQTLLQEAPLPLVFEFSVPAARVGSPSG